MTTARSERAATTAPTGVQTGALTTARTTALTISPTEALVTFGSTSSRRHQHDIAREARDSLFAVRLPAGGSVLVIPAR